MHSHFINRSISHSSIYLIERNSTINTFKNTKARSITRILVAGSNVYYIWINRVNQNRRYSESWQVIGRTIPSNSIVITDPQSSCGCSCINCIWIRRMKRNGIQSANSWDFTIGSRLIKVGAKWGPITTN